MIRRHLLVAFVLPILLVTMSLLAGAAPARPGGGERCFNRGVVPHLPRVYGRLAAQWWQWALGTPIEDNPILDQTGEDQDVNQHGPVWFLGGNFGGTTVRDVVIPRGKFIFVPVINAEWDTVPGFSNPLGLPDPLSVQDIRAITDYMIDGNTCTCTIDGREIRNIQQYRSRSPVFSFDFGPGAAEAFGYPEDHVETAVTDGVWLLLEPLSRGRHTIHFTASSPLGFSLDITYNITVR